MLLWLIGCGEDQTGPAIGPGLTVIAGDMQRDTARGTFLPVTLELRDAQNRPLANTEVVFEGNANLLVQDGPAPIFTQRTTKLTDARGRVSFQMRSACPSGRFTATVRAPSTGATTTVTVTVSAAGGVSTYVSPMDTLVRVGASYRIRARFRDVCGNVQGQDVTLFGGSAAASIESDNLVRALAPGQAQFSATRFGLSFLSRVTVIQ